MTAHARTQRPTQRQTERQIGKRTRRDALDAHGRGDTAFCPRRVQCRQTHSICGPALASQCAQEFARTRAPERTDTDTYCRFLETLRGIGALDARVIWDLGQPSTRLGAQRQFRPLTERWSCPPRGALSGVAALVLDSTRARYETVLPHRRDTVSYFIHLTCLALPLLNYNTVQYQNSNTVCYSTPLLKILYRIVTLYSTR